MKLIGKTRRRISTQKALGDVATLAPVVVSQRLQRLSAMSGPAAAGEMSSLIIEKYLAFANVGFQAWSIAVKAQMQLFSQAFSVQPHLAVADVSSIMTESGEEFAHASATSIARRVRKNLRR